jgi:hypothetical protein
MIESGQKYKKSSQIHFLKAHCEIMRSFPDGAHHGISFEYQSQEEKGPANKQQGRTLNDMVVI